MSITPKEVFTFIGKYDMTLKDFAKESGVGWNVAKNWKARNHINDHHQKTLYAYMKSIDPDLVSKFPLPIPAPPSPTPSNSMLPSPESLRDFLQRYFRERYRGNVKLMIEEEKPDFSYNVATGFLSRRGTPHPSNLHAIADFLREKGILSRLGLPTTPLPLPERVVVTPEEEIQPTATDKRLLASMGIHTTQRGGGKELDALQGEYEQMLIVHAILESSKMTDPQKKRVIGTLLPTLFPESAKSKA